MYLLISLCNVIRPALVLAILIVLGFLCLNAQAEDLLGFPTIVVGRDMLARPGQLVDLEARLYQGDPVRLALTVPGESLSFYFEGKLLDTVKTDENGVARVERIMPKIDNYSVEVRFEGNEKLQPSSGSILIAVRKEEDRIAAIQIEGALSEEDFESCLYTDLSQPEPLPGSSPALTKMTSELEITPIYLAALPEPWKPRVRFWLGKHGYPSCPIFLIDPLETPLEREVGLEAKVRRLKERFSGLENAVAAERSVVDIFRKAGLRTLWLSPDFPEQLPTDVIWAEDWNRIAEAMKGY